MDLLANSPAEVHVSKLLPLIQALSSSAAAAAATVLLLASPGPPSSPTSTTSESSRSSQKTSSSSLPAVICQYHHHRHRQSFIALSEPSEVVYEIFRAVLLELDLLQKLTLTPNLQLAILAMGVTSWVRDDERTWTQKLGANILKNGPIPRHVGFIMDGNRRFADKAHVPKLEGHIKGFEKLTETLRWCLDLGITEVTVYVFSIENFKRPKEEVDGLMKLAKDKFAQLLEEKDKLMEEGVCVQIVGDWSLVPPELKPLMAKAMVLTRDNRRAKLNVAFAYTARNEITRGVSAILEKGIASGDLRTEDVDEDLLSKTFQILPSKPLDLLVRTSGETRLSDFLLWQSAESVLCFTQVLWPEFSYWHLLGAIFHYQLNYFSILQIKKKQSSPICSKDSLKRQDIFIEKLLLERWETLIRDADNYSSRSNKDNEIIS